MKGSVAELQARQGWKMPVHGVSFHNLSTAKVSLACIGTTGSARLSVSDKGREVADKALCICVILKGSMLPSVIHLAILSGGLD